MKLAHICPTAYLEEFGSQGDFTLALAHLLDKDSVNEYEQEITALGLPIYLDNGLFELHIPEPLESLVDKAVRIGATHFFAPDRLYDTQGTYDELNRTVRFLEQLERDSRYRFEKGPPKIAAVVQANNQADYLTQLLDFNDNPNVDLIGLSILSIPKAFEEELGKVDITESRILLLTKMIELAKNKGIKWKKCHLLGLGDSYKDVIFAKKNCPWVVSNDTSCCFQSGLYGRLLNEKLEVPMGKVKEKVDFELKNVPEATLKNIQQNINVVNYILQ